MKCTSCGAEIKSGNLYCEKCGAEVQIVSAYNVMEDELFMEFSKSSREEIEPEKPVPEAHKGDLWRTLALALAGFVLFLLAAFLFCRRAAGPVTDQGFVQALAEERTEDAIRALSETAVTGADKTNRLFWQAWLYGKDGETDRQISVLEEILDADPENSYACRDLINIYVLQEDFAAVHELYERYGLGSLGELFTDYLLDAPTILAEDTRYFAGDTLTIQGEPGQNIYYTMDGSSPITNGTLYYAPIVLAAGNYKLQAVACNEKGYYSTITSCDLTVNERYQLGMPQVTPASGEYPSPQTIYVTVPVGCTAYYTWNGTPTTSSSKYNGGIAMPEGNNVLSVIIVDAYGNESSVQRMNYIYMP